VTYPSNTDPDLWCMDCHRHIRVGEPYSERPIGWKNCDSLDEDHGAFIVELICVHCALAGAA
jgi:hypothetical protein